MLQQYLPFTVLKLGTGVGCRVLKEVATVLTVYGIETARAKRLNCLRSSVATVLTVYGIETFFWTLLAGANFCCNSTYRLRY